MYREFESEHWAILAGGFAFGPKHCVLAVAAASEPSGTLARGIHIFPLCVAWSVLVSGHLLSELRVVSHILLVLLHLAF